MLLIAAAGGARGFATFSDDTGATMIAGGNAYAALVTDISQTAVSFTEVSLLPLLARGERNV